MDINFLLVIIFITSICLVYISLVHANIGRAFIGGINMKVDVVKDLKNNPPSKFEHEIRMIFESLCNSKFPCILPDWLKVKGARLELDGYSAELGIAFEAQGPHHSTFSSEYDLTYDTYITRVRNDEKKIEISKKNDVELIIIDYRLPKHLLFDYIESRLFDICRDKESKFYEIRKDKLPRHLFFDSLPRYIPKQNFLIYKKY